MELLNPKNALLTSLIRALDEINKKCIYSGGLIIPGSWPGQDDDKFILESIPRIKEAKENKIPFLGLCLGMQATAYMERGKKALEKMPKNRQGIKLVKGWWGETYESHWHRYKVVGNFPEYDVYETDGIIEMMILKDHPFF